MEELTPYWVNVNGKIDFEVPQEGSEIKKLILIRKELHLEDKIQIMTVLGDLFSEEELDKILRDAIIPKECPTCKKEKCFWCKNMVSRFEVNNCKSLGQWCHHGRFPMGIRPRPAGISEDYLCKWGCTSIGPKMDSC